MKTTWTLTLLACAAMLSACGGGGNDSGFTQPVNAAAAWQNLYSANRSWTMTGTSSDGLTYTLDLSLTNGGLQTFALTGQPGQARYLDSVLRTPTKPDSGGRITYFLDPGNLVLQGTQNPATAVCARATNSVLPPSATAVATSGLQAQLTGYAGCTMSQPAISNGNMNWGVVYDAGVIYLCTSTNVTDLSGNTYFEEDCFETSTAGQIGSKARIYMRTTAANGTVWTLGVRTP